MLTGPQNADVYTDFNGLAKLKGQARKESPEALKEVAKQFESIFLNNVLKSMREAKLADGAMDNDQSKFYNDMYDQQLAVHLSGSPGVGLADLIVKQLSPDKPKHEKQDIEDYLNRSGGVSRSGTVQAHAVNRHAGGKADSADGQAEVTPYIQDRSPLDEMTEFPFNTNQAGNPLKEWPRAADTVCRRVRQTAASPGGPGRQRTGRGTQGYFGASSAGKRLGTFGHTQQQRQQQFQPV